MTIKSFNTVSKGSNIKSDDFMTVATKTSSTANDGLHDVGIKNISEITRVTSSTETVADNTVKLLGSMIVRMNITFSYICLSAKMLFCQLIIDIEHDRFARCHFVVAPPSI